jgi:hypothetical protein
MSDESEPNNPWQIKDAWGFSVSLLTLIAVAVYAWYARQQVTESQNANSIAKEALAEVNRPYVMSTGIYINVTGDQNKTIHKHLGVNFNNFGNTPAINVTWIQCKTIIRTDIITPTYKCDLDGQPGKVIVLGPKQPMNIVGPAIDDADLEATRSESKSIYVFGYLTYDDKVEDSKDGEHKTSVTSVCYKIIKQDVMVTPTPQPNVPQDVANAAAKLLESQLSPQAPIVGLGCPGFDYCIDEGCKGLPQ